MLLRGEGSVEGPLAGELLPEGVDRLEEAFFEDVRLGLLYSLLPFGGKYHEISVFFAMAHD